MTRFNDQPILEDATYLMRPMSADDYEAMYQAASDPQIWALHPAKDRWQPDVFRKYFDFLVQSGGTLVLINKSDGAIIGCSRYYPTPDVEDSISIGFTFVTRAYWGGTTNRAMKTMMLDHAFKSYGDVWLHIGVDNLRSQNATLKLGATFMYDKEVDLGRAKSVNKCYRITKDAWIAQKNRSTGGNGH